MTLTVRELHFLARKEKLMKKKSREIWLTCDLSVLSVSVFQWVECSPMVPEIWFQCLVVSYRRLLKWYLIPPCLTLSNIRYVSKVKWSNPGKGVAPSSTPRCCSYWKISLLVALDYGCQLFYMVIVHKDDSNLLQYFATCAYITWLKQFKPQ